MDKREQKVSVDDVKVGMYVSRLDRPWLETRYLFQGFRIETPSDIEELRCKCEYVYVDPDKGVTAAHTLETQTIRREKDKYAHVFQPVSTHPVYPVITSLEEEVVASRESRGTVITVVTGILDKSGRGTV